MESQPAQTLDTRGQICPLPVLKARKRLQSMTEGEILRVEATDPMAVIDFPHFCEESGHELVEHAQEGEVYVFTLKKGSRDR